jgi:hypothetical protein
MSEISPRQRHAMVAAAVICGAGAVVSAVSAATSRGSVTAHVITAVCLGLAALGLAWRSRQGTDRSGPSG